MKTALLFGLLLIIQTAAAIEISEIMYNPAGDDTLSEWVEIYNPENLDLSNWTIGDLNSNDTLIFVKQGINQFALIVENVSLFNESNASVYYAGSMIGNGLGNTGDTIFLYDSNKNLIESVSYNNSFANGNNYTIEKQNGSWRESIFLGGTSGYENSMPLVYVNDTTNNTLNITINITANITSNLTNSTNLTDTANITPECFAFLEINTTKMIFEDEPIKFRHIVNSSSDNYSILYWVEDLFGNVAKSPYETKTLAEKSFTPHPTEKDTTYIIKSLLKSCENKNAEKIVIYKTNAVIEDAPVAQTIVQNKSSTSKTETNKTKFQYNLLYYEENITQDAESKAIVEIASDSEPHQVSVSGYIYKGAKKYSDVYEESFTIDRDDKKSVEILLLTSAPQGEYKLKIKINKDSQKTDYEITRNVTVTALPEETPPVEENIIPENKSFEKPAAGLTINITNDPIIYQSKSSKTRGYIPIAIIAVLAGLSAILVWKR